MARKITVWPGRDEDENLRVLAALRRLPEVELEAVAESLLLEDTYRLPFIMAYDGHRYFGPESIERFVRNECAQHFRDVRVSDTFVMLGTGRPTRIMYKIDAESAHLLRGTRTVGSAVFDGPAVRVNPDQEVQVIDSASFIGWLE